MNIKQLRGIEGAKQAIGLTVVIDIMRAATVAAYAFGRGAKSIIPVSTKEEAFALRDKNPEFLLMGEINGIKIDGFDFGNSPSEISKVDLKNKILVQRTTSGTQGLINAIFADTIIFGSFVTCSAIFRFIQKNNFSDISIVSIDSEDEIFGHALESLITQGQFDKEKVRKELYNDPGVEWFVDPLKPDFPKEDIDFALDFDKFNFVCLAKKINDQLIINKVKI
ncbi:MAG: 2-phosphosulfolactate phosphatase [Candidatus Levybacteria bacterium]|nr:2-phosphosulfolactate phosphatase [Candidatus Levybacteria bacterium]